MCEIINFKEISKRKNVFIMRENLLEVEIIHKSGYSVHYFDVQDMPMEYRSKIKAKDKDIFYLMTLYFQNFYADAEVDKITFLHGSSWDNDGKWRDMLDCGGLLSKAKTKIKSSLIKLGNLI